VRHLGEGKALLKLAYVSIDLAAAGSADYSSMKAAIELALTLENNC